MQIKTGIISLALAMTASAKLSTLTIQVDNKLSNTVLTKFRADHTSTDYSNLTPGSTTNYTVNFTDFIQPEVDDVWTGIFSAVPEGSEFNESSSAVQLTYYVANGTFASMYVKPLFSLSSSYRFCSSLVPGR
jgi:hypothetical protein